MASQYSVSLLLASFGLCLGLFLDVMETIPDGGMIFFGKLAEGSKAASPARSKRATETCRSGPITASILEDPLFIIQYDVEQFDACLNNEVLKANLAPLLDQPLPNDYLAVIKGKLDEVYPDGIPDDQLKVLSYFSRLYSPEEIRKWKVTSNDTLMALLNPDGGAWKPDQLKQLISTYLELGGNLTGSLLSALEGRNLCLLEADQLRQISPESIGHAEKLDVSSCSQGQKDILYEKARAAFANQEGTSAYYPLIQPYLGGAPVEDLRKLARSQVAMDINTFTNLKPEELKELSVQDAKDLLGVHLPELKDAESHPSVAMWIKSHFQSELDALGIGLQGGMAAPSPTSGTTAIPFADETSVSVETTNATIIGLHPETAVPIGSTEISDVATTSEGTASRFPVPTTLTDTSRATTVSHDITANVTVVAVTRGINTTSILNTTVSSNVIVDGTVPPTMATHSNVSTSRNGIVASTSVATNGTILPIVDTDISVTTSVATAGALTNVTNNGSVLPTVVTHINATSSVLTTEASTGATTGGTTLPSTATSVNVTSSINTTMASNNITNNGIILHTLEMHINETSTPKATISHGPTPDVNRSSSTPEASLTTSSEQPLPPPGPLPNSTTSAFPYRASTTSGKTSAASSRTTVPIFGTPHGTASSPNPVRPHTTIAATPKKGTTSRAPPETEQPSYPTPNGYINVKPLSASPSCSSLSCLLLTPSLAVGLLVLRGHF
ncbi:uncharacterized protein LOC125431704 [Sphaerodactylus townsendi]|uniref:Uncharacterized protein n=1 Tax=Sphaerodactylus townsendi TaxID=933632 RepID=A0ACB8FKQ9_9SAUR|nr:uncharacterized protein LOC125431704 [Sphaerodactylus townsendi]